MAALPMVFSGAPAPGGGLPWRGLSRGNSGAGLVLGARGCEIVAHRPEFTGQDENLVMKELVGLSFE